jgi:hypothetical protein
MEVHHHAHTARKKWTHYFWEFLMLFLAVFCGFLAELQLEHYIEHQREKQYMKSMLQDLQTDTATIKRVYNRALVQSGALDSLIELGNNHPMNEENISKLYMLHGRTTRFLNIRFEDRTSSQLKNAGGMRLIRNEPVGNAIRQYWNEIESLQRVRDRLEIAGENIADLSSRIFYHKIFIAGDGPLDPPKGIKQGATFINDDPKLLAEYINRIGTKSIRTRVYFQDLETTGQLAEDLIALIKKEYHLQ